MYKVNKRFLLIIICIVILSVKCQNEIQQQISKKNQVQQQQIAIRDQIGLTYGQNTQTLTFSLSHMTDFLIKAAQDEQVKASFHIYWRQHNVYVGSEYREGESVRALVYEDNYKILFDNKFYITHGLKFQAEKGKTYTLRFISEGTIQKISTMEISKLVTAVQQKISKQSMQFLSRRLNTTSSQLKVLSGISQFAVVMHQKAARAMNHNICIYMGYLIVEALVVLAIIGFQVHMLLKLLNTQIIV